MKLEEPKGIAFFNTNSGETHFCKTEPMIQAYINSSDMGINASRGQDFGWKLHPEWVKKVRDFRRNSPQMALLAARHSGQKPTTPQILVEIYGEELRAFDEQQSEEGGAFLNEYQQAIAETPGSAPVVDELDDMSGDDVEIDTDAAAEAATSEAPKKVAKPTQK